jgi:DNA-binding CsgD family transcriptional regulator/catechol 2,3-dioxygenase-like lactoylglutathione lyase family enzyme
MPSVRKRGRPPHPDVLTRTEWAIVHAVQHGMTTREIAKRRGVSFDAVKFHIDNAMAKLGFSNRQALRHWFRIPNESALSVQTPIANASFGLGQIARTVRDIQQSEAWYRDVVGLPHLFTFGKLAFFDCGGVRLYLSQADGELAPESILYFSVANIREAHDTLRGRGVEFINAPHMIHRHADGTEEWMAFFKDPEGRSLAIMSKVGTPVESTG